MKPSSSSRRHNASEDDDSDEDSKKPVIEPSNENSDSNSDEDDSEQADIEDNTNVTQLTKATKEITLAPYKGKIVKKTIAMQNGRKHSAYGFPDEETAKKKEIEWQKRTNDKFFKFRKPLVKGRESYKIHKAVMKQIKEGGDPIKLDGLCRRSFIIALSKILTAQGKMPNLQFTIGDTSILFKESEQQSKLRQRGNFSMEIPSERYSIAYGDGCLKRIKYALELGGKIPKIDDFSKFETCNNHFLNGLLFLVSVVEVLVRSYRTEEGTVFQYTGRAKDGTESDSFPIGMAQARSIALFLARGITRQDFFGQTPEKPSTYRASYGAVTGTGTTNGDGLKVLGEKLSLINEKFNALTIASDDLKSPWRDLKTDYMENNENGYLIWGRSGMSHQLRRIYGSGAESSKDTSDYSGADPDIAQAVPFNLKK